MNTACYQLAEGGRFVPVSRETALARWREGDGEFWINAQDYETRSLEDLLDEIGVSGLLKRLCRESGRATIVIAVPKGTFLDTVVFADRACTSRARVAALCLKNLLVTMSADPIEGADELHREIEHMELESLSTSAILCSLLLRYATTSGRAAREIRERVRVLAERMDRDVGSVRGEELDDLVQSVHLASAIADEEAEAFELLSAAGSAGFDISELRTSLGLLKTMGDATERLTGRLDHRVENLVRRSQDYKQELLNRRLGLLTIISAIFMPLTLLAGIWGMNFEHMPELSHEHAYPAALSLMALLALGGAWLFYKRGWFD